MTLIRLGNGWDGASYWLLPLWIFWNGACQRRYASNDDSAGHANKWKAKHETGNANSEIVVSVHETIKSNHEMSAEGMGRTFCPTPKMATAVAGHPDMVNMGAEAAVRVI